jgi:hypothetical protein
MRVRLLRIASANLDILTSMGPNAGKATTRSATPPRDHYTITPNGCWEWNRSRAPHGYGRTRYGGREFSAHRAFYTHYVAPIPARMVVMHLCDNPPCVNPDHLALSRQSANLGDMSRRGRAARGAHNGSSKLTDAQARDIYDRRLYGEPLKSIADDHGVHIVTVSKIARGLLWEHATNR